MKKFSVLLSMILMAGLLATLPVLADENNSSVSQPTHQPKNQSQMGQSQQAMNFHPFNTKDLLGKTIKDQKGNSIGKVADMTIGSGGRVDFVVISRGGILRKGQFTPVPFKTFISSATNLNDLRKASYIKTSLSKARIDKAPTYSRSHFNLIGSRNKICSYYGAGQCYMMGG
jgi:hypothetical protein